MRTSSAEVIDLDGFRRERRKRSERAGATPTQLPLAAVPAPTWVVWVPVWYVG